MSPVVHPALSELLKDSSPGTAAEISNPSWETPPAYEFTRFVEILVAFSPYWLQTFFDWLRELSANYPERVSPDLVPRSNDVKACLAVLDAEPQLAFIYLFGVLNQKFRRLSAIDVEYLLSEESQFRAVPVFSLLWYNVQENLRCPVRMKVLACKAFRDCGVSSVNPLQLSRQQIIQLLDLEAHRNVLQCFASELQTPYTQPMLMELVKEMKEQ